jgi:hypothetical protein
VTAAECNSDVNGEAVESGRTYPSIAPEAFRCFDVLSQVFKVVTALSCEFIWRLVEEDSLEAETFCLLGPVGVSVNVIDGRLHRPVTPAGQYVANGDNIGMGVQFGDFANVIVSWRQGLPSWSTARIDHNDKSQFGMSFNTIPEIQMSVE